MNSKLYVAAFSALTVATCAGVMVAAEPWRDPTPPTKWIEHSISTRPVGLGLPGGAELAKGVSYAGGVEIRTGYQSPVRSLSDLKLTGNGGFISVSDVGDLVRGRLVLDDQGLLSGIEDVQLHRLQDRDGHPISRKEDGDAEGLALLFNGDLLVSFERHHRIWNYGPLEALERPKPVLSPDHGFEENAGMEALSASQGGWRVASEGGGVWDCNRARCHAIVAPPSQAISDADYRTTGMDTDPSGGWFVVERAYGPPIDARARLRRMDAKGQLGPVLVTLKLPGTVDNFEGIAAERRGDKTRLYILSDDNFNSLQRTLMLAFDVAD